MRVAVLASGGVDSSLALARVVEAGRDASAFYLKVWLEDEFSHLGTCPWEEDLRYVREVCDLLSVPLSVVSLQRVYHERVVSYLLDELERGGTPSPDLLCNRDVKFGAFFDHLDGAASSGGRFDRIATGHHAILKDGPSGVELHRGADPVKDQTYFLARLSESRLARSLFPVGGLRKTEVRRLARGLRLASRDRPDSQGICFLGNVRYRDFVLERLGGRPGPVVREDTGEVIGEHRGHWLFTIGQRRGLGLSGGPWYVIGKDAGANRVVVRRGGGADRSRFDVGDLHWISGPDQALEGRCLVRIRHGRELLPASLGISDGGESGTVRLDAPDPGIAPGQFAVFYRGTRCYGSGRIGVR